MAGCRRGSRPGAKMRPMLVDRRRFLRLVGLSGGALVLPWGCGSSDETSAAITPEPEPEPEKAWWLSGNFAPVEELEETDLDIEGSLPSSLNGLYVRNGPNPQSGESAHWFVGDGMLHGVRLKDGKALWYRARYIQTDALGKEPGELPLGPPGLTDHHANTSVVHHAGRLLSLEEVGLPYRIDPDDLGTLGPFDFNATLTTAMTAHPKIHPGTGELLFFGYGVLDPAIHYHRVSAAGELVQSEKIPLEKAVMMHDFQATTAHVIFMDLPLVFDLDAALAGAAMPFAWKPDSGARLGAMGRDAGADEIEWFDIDPCFIFHTVNAFVDGADTGVLHLDAVRYPKMWAEGVDAIDAELGTLWRYTLTLGTGEAKAVQLDDRPIEFPQIDARKQGRAARFGYALSRPTSEGSTYFDGLLKRDFASGETVTYQPKDPLHLGEALFVPDSDAAGEDEGWLLAYAYDPATDRSDLLVLDATDVAAGPVARVKLPRRVPHGFHGTWVPEAG